MKVIKFNAFVDNDIIEGRPAEMYQVSTLEWDDDGIESAVLFSHKTQTFHTLKAKWFELFQYTGLKDKNGVEIYEGDIVQIIDPDFPVPVQSVVKWNEQGLNWTVWKPNLPKEVQVIGNIYENPELLEKK